MAGDVAARIEAGRAPPASRLEVQSTVVSREVEMTRAEVGAREAEAKVMNALALSATQHPGLRFQTAGGVLLPALPAEALEQALERSLASWPPYQMALLKLQQARLRLAFADNQRQPALDVSASWSSSGLSYRRRRAEVLVKAERYPEWAVGVNLELPPDGNGKADGQYQAQALRVQQGQLEVDAIRNTVANDLAQRHEEMVATLQMVDQMREDLRLRQSCLTTSVNATTWGWGSCASGWSARTR
ncbi:TolC family protein [Ramlibacter terrae]|uniref:TolC family protein n=1 Tax=Ramlibacter terrae TaxID=2732511 RepID=A0ABX6P3F7_9BURK|nr:TolC family protein [Ramlibacter terrae]